MCRFAKKSAVRKVPSSTVTAKGILKIFPTVPNYFLQNLSFAPATAFYLVVEPFCLESKIGNSDTSYREFLSVRVTVISNCYSC